jgi:hypothetical protein
MGPWIIFFIILAVVLAIKWNLPYLIGKSGENFVSRKLLKLDPEHYKVVYDLMLPSLGSTNTTQIDHVVVSNYGVFCIETKNYSGWIFGSAHQQYWTQVIYRYKERFYNPLRQNYAHIKALEALILPSYPNVPICGFVAFPSADKLKISGADNVGYARDIVYKIRGFTLPVLSDAERDDILQKLLTANIQDKESRKLHNLQVRNLQN